MEEVKEKAEKRRDETAEKNKREEQDVFKEGSSETGAQKKRGDKGRRHLVKKGG